MYFSGRHGNSSRKPSQFLGTRIQAIRKLKQLSLLVEPDSSLKESLALKPSEPLIMLNPHFQHSLRQCIVQPEIVPWRDDPKFSLKPDKTCPTRERIEGEMHRKWESVLHFLVGSDPNETKVPYPPESVILFMKRAGLMVETDDHNSLVISDRGYEFMLMDIRTQAWMFVLTLLLEQPTVRHELLTFLFMLSNCNVAEDYPLGALTNAQLNMAKDFLNLGLLHQRRASSTRFYTTSVAVNLVFGGTMSNASENIRRSGLEIIVQTNYQVSIYNFFEIKKNEILKIGGFKLPYVVKTWDIINGDDHISATCRLLRIHPQLFTCLC